MRPDSRERAEARRRLAVCLAETWRYGELVSLATAFSTDGSPLLLMKQNGFTGPLGAALVSCLYQMRGFIISVALRIFGCLPSSAGTSSVRGKARGIITSQTYQLTYPRSHVMAFVPSPMLRFVLAWLVPRRAWERLP